MRWWRSAPEAPPDWLTARPFAHRGLHGGGIAENSRAAFAAAIARGFGIELDVRPARCGTPFVFHDVSLDRLCGHAARLVDLDRSEAAEVRLREGGETIPTLKEILDLVDARVPVLVEVKTDGALDVPFCRRLRDVLQRYPGPVAAMSFDARLMRWLGAHAPTLVRGLVISEQGKSKIRGLIERRLGVTLSKPDFLAYDIRSLPAPFPRRWRRFGRPLLTWTVRTEADASIAKDHADQIIHEYGGAA